MFIASTHMDILILTVYKNHQNDQKPPSARTITLKSATNSVAENNPNSTATIGTKEETLTAEELEDLKGPEVEEAALKIQAVFRGHKTRQTMKQGDNKPTKSEAQELEEEFRSDDVDLTHAATKIQASFRGHMVRKQMEKDEPESGNQGDHNIRHPDDEELDIDLTDPELNKAAIKIQASFRGHLVRKEEENSK